MPRKESESQATRREDARGVPDETRTETARHCAAVPLGCQQRRADASGTKEMGQGKVTTAGEPSNASEAIRRPDLFGNLGRMRGGAGACSH
jgi:hypothetical protein